MCTDPITYELMLNRKHARLKRVHAIQIESQPTHAPTRPRLLSDLDKKTKAPTTPPHKRPRDDPHTETRIEHRSLLSQCCSKRMRPVGDSARKPLYGGRLAVGMESPLLSCRPA